MAIKDLKPRQGKVEVIVQVIDKEEPREFNKFGKTGRVCNAKVKDATGEVKLTLWNEDIEKVNVGDTVKISNGWVGEWQGELQLSTGRFGSMEVIESKGVSNDEETEANILSGEAEKTDKGEHIVTEDEAKNVEKVDEEVIE